MKFKVGDKVKVVKQQKGLEDYQIPVGSVGEVLEVLQVNGSDTVGLAYFVENSSFRVGYGINRDALWFEEDNLELVSNEGQDVVNNPKHYTSDPSGVECIDALRKPIKSDGGSSPYYFSPLPQHIIEQIVETGGIEIKDIVRYCFDNDADCKDIIKALKRIRECKKGGGKEGVDMLYDANKIKFFAEEQYNSILQEGKE